MPAGQPNDPRLSEIHRFLTGLYAKFAISPMQFKRMSDSLLIGDRVISEVLADHQQARS